MGDINIKQLESLRWRMRVIETLTVIGTAWIALGVVPGLAYKEQSLKLEAGDCLFLYTDGISEAMNLRNE